MACDMPACGLWWIDVVVKYSAAVQVQDVEAQQDTVSCIDRPPAQSTGEELGELLSGCSVFSRATPTDRLCIVEQLHAPTMGQSNCVAVCGTGGSLPPQEQAELSIRLHRYEGTGGYRSVSSVGGSEDGEALGPLEAPDMACASLSLGVVRATLLCL